MESVKYLTVAAVLGFAILVPLSLLIISYIFQFLINCVLIYFMYSC